MQSLPNTKGIIYLCPQKTDCKQPMPKRSKKFCVYCGSLKEKLTSDHIPPKCLFATLPPNAITVPSCRKCNKSASEDDEYFRLVCVSNYNGYTHPEQEKLFSKLIRSLDRKAKRISDRKDKREVGLPEKLSAVNSMFKDGERVYIKNTTGIIEPTYAMPIDVSRVKQVTTRIIKGLIWKEHGERLPETHTINIHLDGFHYLNGNPSNVDHKQTGLLNATKRKQPIIVGNDVFAYWNLPTMEDKFAGAWILEFYKQIRFYCFVNKATSPM